MQLHTIDLAIISLYLVSTLLVGFLISKRASRNMGSYFLGGNSIPWYILGVSNASGMFDITGTMWMVYLIFVYGLKGAFIPWLWPIFNQIFLMVYLSCWLRRSNVMTGAEWMKTRFGTGRGAQLSHIVIVIFAIVSVVGFLAYGFKGIGKFSSEFLPWKNLTPNQYGLIFMGITTLYVIKGGMHSVVFTELIQFGVMTVASIAVGLIAIKHVTAEQVAECVPAGWDQLRFGWRLDLDWSGILAAANTKIASDGYGLFTCFIMMILFKGFLLSVAGPVPNYDMQRILATRSPKEAAKMSGAVSVALFFPRYMLIGGLAILALVYLRPDLAAMGDMPGTEAKVMAMTGKHLGVDPAEVTRETRFADSVNADSLAFVKAIGHEFGMAFDDKTAGSLQTVGAVVDYIVCQKTDFEMILPMAMHRFVPVGLLGILMAGLIAAFMSTFAATVNAAPAYIVNDIYKRYINPNASDKQYVKMSYIISLAVVVIGISFGFFVVESIDSVTQWIVSALWGGYAAANVLKWHWWRFNSYGYFWGMIVGLLASLTMPLLLPDVPDFYVFPFILAFSVLGCLAGTLMTQPDEEAVLKAFYKQVRPWGFWGPIREKVMQEDPSFVPNRDFGRDMLNIVVGIIWQISLVIIPIYLIIEHQVPLFSAIATLVITSLILKKNWYDKLTD